MPQALAVFSSLVLRSSKRATCLGSVLHARLPRSGDGVGHVAVGSLAEVGLHDPSGAEQGQTTHDLDWDDPMRLRTVAGALVPLMMLVGIPSAKDVRNVLALC